MNKVKLLKFTLFYDILAKKAITKNKTKYFNWCCSEFYEERCKLLKFLLSSHKKAIKVCEL